MNQPAHLDDHGDDIFASLYAIADPLERAAAAHELLTRAKTFATRVQGLRDEAMCSAYYDHDVPAWRLRSRLGLAKSTINDALLRRAK